MRSRYILYIVAAVAALAVLPTACSEQSPTDDTTIAFAVLKGGAAYRLDHSARDFGRDSDITYYDTMSIVMPTVMYNKDITALQDSILAAACDTVCDSHEEAIKASLGREAEQLGYELRKVEARTDELYEADGLTVTAGDVVSLTPTLLTYRVSKSVTRPGAVKAMTSNYFITYALDRGQIVTLLTIFTPAGIDALPAIIAKKAAKMRNLIGKTDISSLPAHNNFYLTVDGSIVFVYQPYEASSYSTNEIYIPFEAYQLSEYMTETGLQLFGLAE